MGCLAGTAEAQRLQTEQLSERHGLPDARLTDVVQAVDGRIWFAARGGVAAFDGVSWEEHNPGGDLPGGDLPRQGLPESFLPERLAAGPDGRIWVLPTEPDQGLACFDGAEWRIIEVPSPESHRGEGRNLDVLVDEHGSQRVVVAGHERVWIWDEHQWFEPQRARGWKSGDVHSVHAHADTLYIGSARGLEVLRPGQDSFEGIFDLVEDEGPLLALTSETTKTGHRLWLATPQWIASFDGSGVESLEPAEGLLQLRGRHSTEMVHDGLGTLYFGTANTLWKCNLSTGDVHSILPRHGMISNGSTGLLRDREQNVWVTCLRGATRIPPQQFVSFDAEQGLHEDEVSALEEIEPGIILAGHESGLSLIEEDRVVMVVPFFESVERRFEYHRVLDLHADGEGGCWVAAGEFGVGHWSRTQGLRWLPGPERLHCSSVVRDSRGKLLISSYTGMMTVVDGRIVPDETPLDGLKIRKLFDLRDGKLYASILGGGLYALHEGSWSSLLKARKEVGCDIYSMALGLDSRLMLGTSDGLFELADDRTSRIETPYAIDDPVYSILEQGEGQYYFGTGRGVRHWDGTSLHQYREMDGLLGYEANRDALTEDSLGRIWIGTNQGLSRRSELELPHDREPHIELLDVKVQGAPMKLAPHVVLESYSDLEFRVRAVSFARAGAAIYRACLHGFDADWIAERPVTSNELRYTNLPPGDYSLDLQARVGNGPWGPITSSAPFTIATPVWQTWWFFALLSAAVLAAGSFFTTFLNVRRRSAGLAVQVRKSNDALEESERRYREMFEKNPAIQLLLEPHTGRILEANAAAADYFGNSPDDLRHQSFSDLTGLPSEVLVDGLNRLSFTGEWVVRPSEVDPVFGPPIEIRTCLYPLRGEQIVQASIYDIEAHQRLEQQLQESQKLRAVGELARGVAHDFNNLLTAILGNSELIRIDSGGDERLRGHLDQIREAGESGSVLVKKLLAFGRKQELRHELLELNEVITEVSSILRSALGSRVVVILDLDDSVECIRADRNQIERALINLALNARDAMPEGGTLTLETRCAEKQYLESHFPEHDTELDYARLSICDTGAGMTEEARRRAFEPFFTTKDVDTKSGLGLSTVHGIIGQYGGETSIESKLGEGTTVHIFLPMSSTVQDRVLEPVPRSGNFPTQPRDQTVLLVDDDEIVRSTIASLLSGTGRRVIQAATAQDAKARYFENDGGIDVVLADLRLPDEHGRELGQALRRERPDLPMIFMSGYYDEAIRSDNEVFLMKPFSLDKLSEALERVI